MKGSVIESRVNPNAAAFRKNQREMVARRSELKNLEEAIRQAGGPKAVEGQHAKGRLTARERIARLIDPKTEFFELGLYAAHGMYQEWGGAPAA